MAYGGVMPLYAVLAREYFGQRIMGSVFGAFLAQVAILTSMPSSIASVVKYAGHSQRMIDTLIGHARGSTPSES